ncbi:PEP-CTERM sorting domain-containing protein [Planctomycetales bacterium ZRK34]|nr:PEP-CTERM sorting domain-containing protein [Planctomycetales bacterium ZRK34]
MSWLTAPTVAEVTSSGTVFPNVGVTPTGNGQISVGFGSSAGELEINAASTGNAVTAIDGEGLLVGRENGADGVVRIIGDGTAGSAMATINDGIGVRIGFGGNGRLEIRSGGVLESNEQIHFGEEPLSATPGAATVIVDGPGSALRSIVPNNSSAAGRIQAPFGGHATADITISNGGLIEAVGGDLANFDQASIFLGGEEDFPTQGTVNITGEGSTLQATHFIGLRNGFGSAAVNITDGGQMNQLEHGLSFGGDPVVGISVNSFDPDARITVSGMSTGGMASSVNAIDNISIGSVRRIQGFTADGDPRVFRDFNTLAGDPILDQQGNPLFDAGGKPIIGVERDIFGDGSFIIVEPDMEVFTKQTGHLLVENGAVVHTDADITVSDNDADPRVTPSSGQDSTLTVRSGGLVEAQNVIINEHGRLDGGGGTITADVQLNGGTIAPGNSPGDLFIDGDLNLLDGVLELEVESAAFDTLTATGNVVLGEDLVINLLFGFDPAGQTIDLRDFFETPSLLSSNFDFDQNLHLTGLGSGASGTVLGFNGETLDIASTIPSPAAAPMALCLLAALALKRRR